ncbi:MAG: hypothetical protein COA65_01375 [Rhodospirillaceae bacterium]|nr:MAG: hypothetical protein COA65_01375 [Rhodospirillaceae bacterium]
MTDELRLIEIEYCTGCKWLPRAAWVAQELLGTFEGELRGVTLIPNTEGGVFRVRIAGGEVLWDRKVEGLFPEIKELKQRLRDIVALGRDLGHIDKPHGCIPE